MIKINPAKANEKIIAQYTAAVQKRLDDFAQTRNYSSIMSATTYAASTVPRFRVEGQHALMLRDSTWIACYMILAAVESGSRPAPTIAELFNELPVLRWP